MAYCTQADLIDLIGEERLSQLSDRERTAEGYINATRVAKACDDASSLIDSYAAKHWAVPFADASPVIRALAARLAIYGLIEGGSMGPTPEQVAEQGIRLKWLEDLAAHKVTPGTTPSPAPHTMVVDATYERPATKTMSRNAFKGFS